MIGILKNKNLYKKLCIIGVAIYVVYIFVNQQKNLDSYASRKKYYTEQIEEQKQYNSTLLSLKENANSPEYIEQIAREKLDMYLPNEKVYIDISN